jgi:uncharacterized membrane protein
MVATMLMVTATPSAGGPGSDHTDIQDGFVLIGGIPWSPDIRVTFDPSDDVRPQVTADKEHFAHIVWERSGMWTQTIDRTGIAMSKEVFITPHVVSAYGAHPIGPTAAIDSHGNIHVVWDDGWTNVYYQKYDRYGNVITDVIHVGNEDNTASHMPAIAVDPVNEYVHIIHEDYEYQCEDIVYDKLDNNGKILINEVAVSSDVSSHCEFSTLTTDAFGFIHVVFGTASGAMWRKVDQNGVARGLSTRIFPEPVYAIPDLAVTPNGDIHMVWSANQEVLYTRMDNNGSILEGGVPICSSDVPVGMSRVAAAHESNTVYIVWTDYRDGNGEIYFAEMREGMDGGMPENHRLTSDRARSMQPDVTVDPEEEVHVVWVDERDGNAEVYYKTMYPVRFELSPVDISELCGMYFYHPGQTKVEEMYIENQGLLEDGYDVSLILDEWARAAGWSFQLDRDRFRDVPGDARVFFNLSLTAPFDATSGDHANVSLRATSFTSPSVNKTLSWRSFVIVAKGVTVTCWEPTKLIDPGGTVRFDLKIFNVGDVPDMYTVVHSLVPEDKGWEVLVDAETVMLDVGENTTILVVVTAPPNAKTDMSASVYLRVQSMTDKSVWDGKKLTALVNPTFHLAMEVQEADKCVDPGGSVQYAFTMRNDGTFNGDVELYLSSTETLPGWTAVLSTDTLFLRGGEELLCRLTVTAPRDALAGLRQVIKVNAVSEKYSTSGQVEVTAIVNQVHGLSPAISCEEHNLHAGEEAGVNGIMVYNDGNGLEHVSIGIVSIPKGWNVHFEDDGVEITSLVISPKLSKSFFVYVSTPKDALAGANTISLVLTDSTGEEYPIAFHVGIHQMYGFDLTASSYEAQGPPGGEAHYMLSLDNEGNGEDTFQLDLQGLPSARWVSSFQGPYGQEIDSVTLEAGELRSLDLVVRVPEDTNGVFTQEIVARAISKSAEVDEVRLTLGVVAPDIKVQSIEYDPAVPRIGEPNRIVVYIVNDGSYRADHVQALLLVNDNEVGRETIKSINPGGNSSVVFTWSPSAGRNVLTFRASCEMQEYDYDNNEVTHQKGNRESPGGVDWSWLPMAILALGAVLLFLFIVRADHKDRTRGR